MKHVLLLLTALALMGGLLLIWKRIPAGDERAMSFRIIPATPTPVLAAGSAGLSLYGTDLKYGFTLAGPGRKILLIPNFEVSSASAMVYENHDCTALVNGGFYDTRGQPLGLFAVGDRVYSGNRQDALFDGYLSLDRDGTVSLGYSAPTATSEWILQTGPVMMDQSSPRRLAIRNDEPARRSVAAVTAGGELVLISIFDSSNVFLGPKLEEVPDIVAQISETENLNLESAVNLDGGSASAYRSSDLKLSELTPVGSFICIL